MMKLHQLLLTIFVSVIFTCYGYGQEYKSTIALARVVDGDTLIIMNLPTVYITGTMIFKNKRKAKKYSRLVYNVKKAYPYAYLAGIKLEKYNDILASVTDQKERKKILKQAEKELLDEYGDELKKLTFSQGKILLKLIDRQSGNTSYELVADLRGKFSAFFWQSLARIFSYNLKVAYDPEGEDKEIEQIVQMIEHGEI
ncbi:MAG: DUF4294 domain-containing protein [Bacteroidales bacterium]|nr:DUF4294 domain-containing protein [Bacteroidales bacterium]